MSVIVRNLFSKIITKGLGPKEDQDDTLGFEELEFDIENNITYEKEFYPLTGTFADKDPWKYNLERPQDLSKEETRLKASLGGYSYNLEEGTVEKDWNGFIKSNLSFIEVINKKFKTKAKKWVPVVSTGSYSIYHFYKRLYSNCSISKIYTPQLDNELYKYVIEEDFLENSLTLVRYKRNNSFINIPYQNYKLNLDMNSLKMNEFFLSENKELITLTSEEVKVGVFTDDINIIENMNEFAGYGKETKAIIYTEYFPFKDIKLQTIHNGTLQNWTEVSNFKNSRNTDYHFIAAPHNGKLILNINTIEKKVYTKSIEGKTLHTLNEIISYPDTGFISILLDDGSKITREYYEKTKYSFRLTETIESIYQLNTIELLSTCQPLKNGSEIFLSYISVPRLEYELKEANRVENSLNLKPYNKLDANGVISISASETHVSSIKLTTDLTKLSQNFYGTLEIQGNPTVLNATAFDNLNNPVSDVKIKFMAEEGLFENQVKDISKVTNYDGVAQTIFSYPYSNDALSFFTNAIHSNGSTYFDLQNVPPITPNDISLFQVMKTDPFYSSLGLKLKIKSHTTDDTFLIIETEETILDSEEYKSFDVNPNDSNTAFLEAVSKETFRNFGQATLYKEIFQGSPIGFNDNKIIIQSISDKKIYIFLTPQIRRFIGLGGMNIQPGTLTEIRIFKRNEIKWDSNAFLDNTIVALQRIVYKLENNSFVKAIPDRIVNNRMFFDNMLLPIGDLHSYNNIIAGYKIYHPKIIKVFATCIDPATGKEITSNILKIKVDFPVYLKSTQGFKFKEITDEISAGIGGANFLTINPQNQYQLDFTVEY